MVTIVVDMVKGVDASTMLLDKLEKAAGEHLKEVWKCFSENQF